MAREAQLLLHRKTSDWPAEAAQGCRDAVVCCGGAVVVGGWDAWAVVRECALEVVAAAAATTFATAITITTTITTTTTTTTTIITITINTHS